MDLAPAELALRVGIAAGALGVLGWLPANLQWLAAFALLIAAVFCVWELWAARGSRKGSRGALAGLAVTLAGAGMLIWGVLAAISTPLLALAGVCIALWFAATLGDSGNDAPDETLH